jgi:F-type H+-transporting ATPase subunit gamma
MANLKTLKNRIKSVKSTQKITKAMKMVAASKLRRARMKAEAAQPYAARMEKMLGALAAGIVAGNGISPLIAGTGKDTVQLVIVATSDRGLCGAFNSSIVRAARKKIQELLASGKEVKILCVGKKGYDQLKSHYGKYIIDTVEGLSKQHLTYGDAEALATRVIALFAAEQFDVCSIFYNAFKSVISQVVTCQQLIPLDTSALENTAQNSGAVYEFEPNEETILDDLLPRNIAVQIYHALLENAASEQGARMSAMDNATRNAGEMIKDLTLVYNRTRQAAITRELIEIISGAEAL